MKKFIGIVLLCLLVTGCAQTMDIKKMLDTTIAQSLSEEVMVRQNQNSVFYRYYLPSDVYRHRSTRDSAILELDGYEILMNLNITNIVTSRKQLNDMDVTLKEEGFYSGDQTVYQTKGSYQDYDERERNFLFTVYDVNGRYLVSLLTDDMNYHGYSSQSGLSHLTRQLFTIAKSLSVNSEDVVSYYANTDVIDYKKKQVDLFETIIPKDGRVEDLMANREDILETEIPTETEEPVIEEPAEDVGEE